MCGRVQGEEGGVCWAGRAADGVLGLEGMMTSREADDFIGFIVLVILVVVALHLLFMSGR